MKKWIIGGITAAVFCTILLYAINITAKEEGSSWSRFFSVTQESACDTLKQSLKTNYEYTGKIKSYSTSMITPASMGGDYDPAVSEPEMPVYCEFEFEECSVRGQIRKHIR